MLQQLGFNWTFFIQFGIFIFAITFLALYVFKPYTDAVTAREAQTKGSEDLATDLDKKSIELYGHYEKRARDVHSQIQDVYKSARSIASQENEKIISSARAEAQVVIESNRSKIKASITAAQATLKQEIPNIVQSLTQKLLGKQ